MAREGFGARKDPLATPPWCRRRPGVEPLRGLDTPVLLALLRGEGRVSSYLRKWEAEELCTTVVNLFELETIARADRSPGRERRLAALERLRRKLTVLPVDERSARLGAQEAAKGDPASAPPGTWLILGALIAAGCSEWISTREARFPASADLRIVILGDHRTKKH